MSAKTMSMDATLRAELDELRAEKAQRTRLAGVEIDLVEGISKAKKPYRFLQVKGGPFSWRGLNLSPATWNKLKELSDEIDEGMRTHFPDESF